MESTAERTGKGRQRGINMNWHLEKRYAIILRQEKHLMNWRYRFFSFPLKAGMKTATGRMPTSPIPLWTGIQPLPIFP